MTRIVLTLTLLFSSFVVFAGSPVTPIDGGLSILLVAAGAYGAKKIYDNQKDN